MITILLFGMTTKSCNEWSRAKHVEFEAIVRKFPGGDRKIDQGVLCGIEYARHVYRYDVGGGDATNQHLAGIVAWPVCYEHGESLLSSIAKGC